MAQNFEYTNKILTPNSCTPGKTVSTAALMTALYCQEVLLNKCQVCMCVDKCSYVCKQMGMFMCCVLM